MIRLHRRARPVPCGRCAGTDDVIPDDGPALCRPCLTSALADLWEVLDRWTPADWMVAHRSHRAAVSACVWCAEEDLQRAA